MKLKISSLLLLLLFFFQACKDSDKDSAVPCIEDASIHTVDMYVQDQNGKPVSLDSVKVFVGKEDISLIKDFTSQSFISQQELGKYIVISDGIMQNLFLNKKVDVQFKAYIGRNIVAERTVRVSANECHVYGLTKDLTIVLESMANRL